MRAVVVASSDKAYGAHDELPYGERHSLQPAYPYDVSKACADLVARSYAHTYGLPAAVTRLANIYGRVTSTSRVSSPTRRVRSSAASVR